MTQEDKELLLKDICARLPYGVKMINTEPYSDNHNPILTLSHISEDNAIGCRAGKGFMTTSLGSIKPYLFPLSSMTEEQKKEFDQLIELELKAISDEIDHTQATAFEIDFYHKHHLDWRGLIPMGLAIDATELNIY